jgi:hypothetical protein
MQKKQLILLIIFVIVTIISVILLSKGSAVVKATNPRISKRDIPEYGILIITASDNSFTEDINRWTRGRTNVFNENATALLPFSFFIKNMSNKDIIAYKLRWEVRNSEGAVKSYVRSYFQPDSIMGVPNQDNNPRSDNESTKIRKNSAGFFTIIPTPFENETVPDSGIDERLRQKYEVFNESIRNGSLSRFVSTTLPEELAQTTEITVYVEGALFEDGQYVGESDELFTYVKAYTSAKRDLLRLIINEIRNGVSPSTILDGVSVIANEPRNYSHNEMSSFRNLYNLFRKQRAEDIIKMRQAFRNDNKTLGIALKPYKNQWVKPFDAIRPSNNR